MLEIKQPRNQADRVARCAMETALAISSRTPPSRSGRRASPGRGARRSSRAVVRAADHTFLERVFWASWWGSKSACDHSNYIKTLQRKPNEDTVSCGEISAVQFAQSEPSGG